MSSWLWFFGRNVRLLAGAALRDDSTHGWLLAGLAASVLGFAVGMSTYDAFGFTQATLLMFAPSGSASPRATSSRTRRCRRAGSLRLRKGRRATRARRRGARRTAAGARAGRR